MLFYLMNIHTADCCNNYYYTCSVCHLWGQTLWHLLKAKYNHPQTQIVDRDATLPDMPVCEFLPGQSLTVGVGLELIVEDDTASTSVLHQVLQARMKLPTSIMLDLTMLMLGNDHA